MAEKVAIGKSEKGKVVHLIAPGNVAVCDKKLQNLVTDDKLNIKDVTCKKCQERKLYKDLLAEEKPSKPVKAESPPPKEADKKSIGLATAKYKPKKKELKKTRETNNDSGDDFGSLPKTVVTFASPGGKSKDQFEMRENSKTGQYQVVHVPTRKVFFDSIPEEVILDAVLNLNEIEDWWANEKHTLPEGFIGNCRFALKQAYEKAEIAVPKNLKEVEKPKPKKKSKKVAPSQVTEEFSKGDQMVMVVDGVEVLMQYDGSNWKKAPKPKAKKRVIRRRPPVEPPTPGKPVRVKSMRRLKRRTKKTTEKPKREIKRRKDKVARKEMLHGCREGTPGYTIAQMLEEGTTAIQMIEKLEEEHGLNAKKAGRKISGTIKKICRIRGVPITLTMQPIVGEDFYIIKK